MDTVANNNRANIREGTKCYYLQKNRINNSGTKDAFSYPPYLGAKGVIITYENQLIWQNLDATYPENSQPVRIENDIKTFSRNSRRRLFSLFTQMEYSRYGQPRFVSSTWHYDNPDKRIEIKSFLANYINRLKRNLPPFHAIWKLEYQQRGTPHFHFMIFPLDKKNNLFSESSEKIITDHWLKMKKCRCSGCKIHAVKVVPLKEYKHALIYIGKEIAKLQDSYLDHDLGRVWGNSHGIYRSSIESIFCTYKDYSELLQSVIDSDKFTDNTKLYATGLRTTDMNSSLFISNEDIKLFLLKLKSRKTPQTIKKNNFTMRKYSWLEKTT